MRNRKSKIAFRLPMQIYSYTRFGYLHLDAYTRISVRCLGIIMFKVTSVRMKRFEKNNVKLR